MNHTTIYVRNDSGYKALIQFYHVSKTVDMNGGSYEVDMESGGYLVESGGLAGPLQAGFKWGPGDFSDMDLWTVRLTIFDDSFHGVWDATTELQLRHGDAGKTFTFSVSTRQLTVSFGSRSTTATMTRREYIKRPRVSHVFVLMLENHSFDNIFARSGIPGITVASADNSNTYGGKTYYVTGGAPSSMPTDPGHEFQDVVEQLSGNKNNQVPNKPYPAINSSGFASNYATTTTEGPTPQAADIGKIMACFDTRTALPTTYQLATEFAICDHWFSSLPGPTWPNRYFVHGASSNGMDHSPSSKMAVHTESTSGFTLPHGSIFDSLRSKNLPWRIFYDVSGPLAGHIPQVASLKNLQWPSDTIPLDHLDSLLSRPYTALYTFIEPSYGDVRGNTFQGGSSQHPMDSMAAGEALIKRVYDTLRRSPLWYSSMLIVTYDEHGGFYDSVAPPKAQDPGDGGTTSPNNQSGFLFQQYGVRVPAMIVSPWIPKGTVSTTTYDHASVLKTIEGAFDLGHLTKRDDEAHDLLGLAYATGVTAPRTDCPMTLDAPAPVPAPPPLTPEEQMALDQQPLPETGNIWGFIAIALKTEIEALANTEAEKSLMIAHVNQLKTYGEARDYLERIVRMAEAG